jgi:acyl carrier protein
VAYVVLRPNAAPTTSELRGYLKEKLPDYMIPSTFMFLQQLPLSSHGKIDRRALPAPGKTRPGLQETFVAPRTALESVIADAWKAVLGVERVGVYDNFFDLGGHSLLSIQAIARLEKETGLKMNPKAFVTQTLGQLASSYQQRMGLLEQTRSLGRKRKIWSLFKSVISPKQNDRR